MLQYKNKDGETPLQIFRYFIIKKELAPYLNGTKFQKDFDEFVNAYHSITNLEKNTDPEKLSQLELILNSDNLIFKRYKYHSIKKQFK